MKGLFIPGITAEMFRNGCLESIEALMAKGEIYDIEYYPKAENEKEDVLDKIRTEIEQLTSRYSISKERGGMGIVEWSDRLIKESDVLQIIDKYKAESEDKA